MGPRGSTEIIWKKLIDQRVRQYVDSIFPVEGIGKVIIDVAESEAGLPTVTMDESYSLDVSEDVINISSPSSWGACRAITTLYQLQRTGGLVRSVSISDSPRFAWRGLLIDVARHFLPIALLERVLDGMALLKLNVLHIHLSDDQAFRFESFAFPKLASEKHYSQSELTSLVAYAADRGIRVVAELDVPGHVTSWIVQYPEWGVSEAQTSKRFGVHRACLDPTSDGLYRDLALLFSEVAGVFPDEYLHLGGDEVHSDWWESDDRLKAFSKARGLSSVPELQNFFSNKMYEILTSLGKRAVAWDEVLHPSMSPYVIQNWRGASTRDQALVKGFDCIFSSGFYLDLFYPSDMHYLFDPEASQRELFALEDAMKKDMRLAHIAEGLKWTDRWRTDSVDLSVAAGNQNLGTVLGGEACLWGELVSPETLFPRLWSRLPAVAERLWSKEDVTDVDDFYCRLSSITELDELNWASEQDKGFLGAGLSKSQIPIAKYFEPAKWYFRLLGEQVLKARIEGGEMPISRPYDMASPLDRVVDFLTPESIDARKIRGLKDRESLLILMNLWASQKPDDWPEDMWQPVEALGLVAGFVIAYLTNVATKAETVERLAGLYVPYGEYMLGGIPPIMGWLENDE